MIYLQVCHRNLYIEKAMYMHYTRNSLGDLQTNCTNNSYYLDITKVTDTFDETYVTNSYYDEVEHAQVHAHIKHTKYTCRKSSKLKLLHALRTHNVKHAQVLLDFKVYLPHRVKKQREPHMARVVKPIL